MSDPRYAHEFLPNRKGHCKYIVGFEMCGLSEFAPVHVRQLTKGDVPVMIPVPVSLLKRICEAFLDMLDKGVVCKDPNLMEDLDTVLASYDRKR